MKIEIRKPRCYTCGKKGSFWDECESLSALEKDAPPRIEKAKTTKPSTKPVATPTPHNDENRTQNGEMKELPIKDIIKIETKDDPEWERVGWRTRKRKGSNTCKFTTKPNT